MKSKKHFSLVSLLMASSMIFAACNQAKPADTAAITTDTESKTEKKLVIGSVIMNTTAEWFTEVINSMKKAGTDLMEEMFEYFLILRERRKQIAGTMSGGQQQIVAIARGLMSNPKLIMFDEPSLGLAPVIEFKGRLI